MNTEQAKLLRRSIIFVITAIGFFTFLTFDLGYAIPYKLDDPNHVPFTWLMFWTHLSNIGAMIWISLALTASIGKYDKLEYCISSWFIKNMVYTFIIVTGLVFVAVAYIPTIIKYATPGYIEGIGDASLSYRFMVILGTTFKHVIIPGMFIYLAIIEKGYSKTTDNLSSISKSMILFIFPFLYFVYVILFTSLGVPAPYPVLDYVDPEGQYEVWQMFIFLILDLIVGSLYIFISYLQFWWDKKQQQK